MKTNKLCVWTAVCASVLMLPVFPAAADQTVTAAKPEKIYTGTVVSVNPNGRTLEVKGLLFNKKFNLGDNCAYVLWDKPAGTVSDLRAGEKVKVAYQNANGVLVADRVKQELMTDQGMVKFIDLASQTLTLHSGWGDKTFRIPNDCAVVLHDDKSGSLADVQPGYYVTVTYELPHGKPVARQVAQTATTFTGELTAVDLGNRTVKAKSLFDSKVFHLADNCAIVVNGKPDGKLSDLKLGDQTSFSYEDVNGVNVVNRIANQPIAQETETTSIQPAAR